MNKFKKGWTIKKHIIFSIILSVFIQGITYISSMKEETASIGIIGGADGPTAIFISNKMVSDKGAKIIFDCLSNIGIFILVFIILLILYKPIKYIINRLFMAK